MALLNADEPREVPRTPVERAVLAAALNSWVPGGIPRSTEELAIAMGFESVSDLHDQAERMEVAVDSGSPLTRRDWARAVILLEIGFASDAFGNGQDWSSTYLFSDAETVAVLREIQGKIHSRELVGKAFGTYMDNEFGY